MTKRQYGAYTEYVTGQSPQAILDSPTQRLTYKLMEVTDK